MNINIILREEFVSTYASGLRGPMMSRPNFTSEGHSPDIKLEDLPSSVDWRQQGVIVTLAKAMVTAGLEVAATRWDGVHEDARQEKDEDEQHN